MKLIDKDAVVAEIESKKNMAQILGDNAINGSMQQFYDGMKQGCIDILSFLDALEVKEVDLEDNIKESLAQKYIDYTFKRHNIDPESKEGQLIYYAYIHGMNQCLNQLKAQKGE